MMAGSELNKKLNPTRKTKLKQNFLKTKTPAKIYLHFLENMVMI